MMMMMIMALLKTKFSAVALVAVVQASCSGVVVSLAFSAPTRTIAPTLNLSCWPSSRARVDSLLSNSVRRNCYKCSRRRTRLNNLPLEDALEIELDEMELELDIPYPKDPDDESPRKAFQLTDACSIIAGTAIGGGFLALPTVTTPIGYWPTALGLFAAWVFLLLSACSFVESAGLVADLRWQQQQVEAKQQKGQNEGAISVATVLRYAFGKKIALVGGFGFILQMFAIVTAQIVKGAELIEYLYGLPYVLGCLLPPALAAALAFGCKPRVVEGANTTFTATMIVGFATLIAGTLVASTTTTTSATSLFARSDWNRLLPNMKTAWAMPIFINLLCFGQSMPLVVERMMQSATTTTTTTTFDDNTSSITTASTKNCHNVERDRALMRSRKAAFLGSVVPLCMCLCWAAIATALVSPTSTNPLFSLLAKGPAIHLPVCALSLGAIGTTLFGSFLAMGHFASDVVCMKLGYCSRLWMGICNSVTVAVPCALACLGPSLYLPLLTFAGAYPTTILHGLTPALAAIALRKKLQKNGEGASSKSISLTPHIVPGGKKTLVGVSIVAIGLVGASSVLSLRHFVRALGAPAVP